MTIQKICKVFLFENRFRSLFIGVTRHGCFAFPMRERKEKWYFKESPFECTHMVKVVFSLFSVLPSQMPFQTREKCSFYACNMFICELSTRQWHTINETIIFFLSLSWFGCYSLANLAASRHAKGMSLQNSLRFDTKTIA